MYFRKCQIRKTWLDKCLKSLVSEDSSNGNMVNGPKHSCNLNEEPLPYLLITGRIIELEKVSFSET